ncbi:MAG: hypothetical protein QM765_17075 [Myxococcales bacterium]
MDAILKYRDQTRIADPADLVAAAAITQEQLLHIAAFLVLGDPSKVPLGGRLRLMAAYSSDDYTGETTGAYKVSKATQYPPAFLQAKVKGPLNLTAGLAMATTRSRLAWLHYSLEQDRLVASQPYNFHVPKYYVQWKNSMFQVVAGTFRLGFGQKLTLDNTSRSATPNGVYPDDKINVPSEDLKLDPFSGDGIYVTRDYSWSDAFRGVAVSARHIPLGGPELALHAFGSYQSRSIYQYEIFDRRQCDDPHSLESNCSAPVIGVADDPEAYFVFSTLPEVYDELAAGGNVTVQFTPSAHLGVSGYYAQDIWGDAGILQLDFQEWSSRPYGGSFGAVGIDGAAKAGHANLFAEATRTFNAMPGKVGGGGWGGLVRIVGDVQKTHELEGSVRYYDRGFVNPLGRPLANPDKFEGQRARNEAGAKVKYTGKPTEDWKVRADVDFSIWPEDGRAAGTAGLTNLDLYLRTDFVGWRRAKVSLGARYRNKDLGNSARGECYEYPTEYDEDSQPLPCRGETWRFAVAASYAPLGKKLSLAAEYQHHLLDDPDYPDTFRQDLRAWVQVTSQPVDQLILRWRLKYQDESIDNPLKLETVLWTYLDVGVLPMSNSSLELHVRYDLYSFLDQRESTTKRHSPIQHRFRLELEARF